jgi:hypothetical protein
MSEAEETRGWPRFAHYQIFDHDPFGDLIENESR